MNRANQKPATVRPLVESDHQAKSSLTTLKLVEKKREEFVKPFTDETVGPTEAHEHDKEKAFRAAANVRFAKLVPTATAFGLQSLKQ